MNPVIIYQSKDYNDADSVQKYIADIAKDNLNVSKSRNGDLLQISLTGSDDAINAWLNFYKDMFDQFTKDMGTGRWTPIDELPEAKPMEENKTNKKDSMKNEGIEELRNKVISDGTMRSEDLIPKFLGVLKQYAKDAYDAYVKDNPEVLDLNSMDDETMGWVVDELFDELNKIAPENCYFGASEGDGACYGFWSVDANESAKNETTYKQGLDDFLGFAPEGGWSDYWSMQQDWEFYKDGLCRDGVITQRQADSWSNPCTPETFDRWQKRNGLTRRPRAWDESNQNETDILSKLKNLESITDASDLIDAIKALGFYEIEYGDYGGPNSKSYAVFKGPNGEYAEMDYNWKRTTPGKDSWVPDEVLSYAFFADKSAYEDEHGYSPRESNNKSEASKFGSGSKNFDKKDLSKAVNLGDVLAVFKEHQEYLKKASEDLSQSKDDLKAIKASLDTFSENLELLKEQSVQGIKKALDLQKSPEVEAAAKIEAALKDNLSILYKDYNNIKDVSQLITVIDSQYASQGAKLVTTVQDGVERFITVEYKDLKDAMESGEISSDDLKKRVSLTYATKGMQSKGTYDKVNPVLEKMNAMLNAATKIEEAVIDPKEFKELRDIVEKIVTEASAPKITIKTEIGALSKDKLDNVARESKMSEGLLDKLKSIVSAFKDKIINLWDSFTSLFFDIDEKAQESSTIFDEVEMELAENGIEISAATSESKTIHSQFEALCKAVLHTCDNLAKDSSLAGEFDDELIYAEDAVKNAIESFQEMGKACQNLKRVLEYHKNEDNMAVIGILSDAITQIVADEQGEESDADTDDSEEMIRDVEREYSSEPEDLSGFEPPERETPEVPPEEI